MYRISELVGKSLLDDNSSMDCGQICDFVYDKTTGVGAFATDTGKYTADKLICASDTVRAIGIRQYDGGKTLVGKVAYDTTGKYLGKIYEVEFGSTLKPRKVVLIDGTEYGRGRIYAVQDVALIRPKVAPRPKRTAKAAPTRKATASATIVAAATTTNATPTSAAELTQKQPSNNARWLQNRKYGDFSFLIGKTTDKTITNFQGEVMVKYGERVTPTILRQAKISGKLIELCLHTK